MESKYRVPDLRIVLDPVYTSRKEEDMKIEKEKEKKEKDLPGKTAS